MPPSKPQDLGERLAGMEARFESFERYTHERWHQLNNDLQPLTMLPERIARDMGKIQGIFEGRIVSVSKDLERSMEAAIEKALRPATQDIKKLQTDVDRLKIKSGQDSALRRFFTSAIQTILAAIGAFAAIYALMPHH
jgi:hypothetical protein